MTIALYEKPYEVCYTSVRETKALTTEILNFSNQQETVTLCRRITGTEEIAIELNDEICFMTDPDSSETELNRVGSFTAKSVDGETVTGESFGTFEEMYEKLPKGKYYIDFLLQVYGNHIFGENGEYIGFESKNIAPAFILEIK